jgi:hypothetical protein
MCGRPPSSCRLPQSNAAVKAWDAVTYLRRFLKRIPAAALPPQRAWVPQPPRYKSLALTREQVRGRLRIPSPYFVNRGLSPQVLDRMDVGHSEKLNRTVIPVYDDSGRFCVGFTTRREDDCRVCKKCHAPGEPCEGGQRRWDFMEDFEKSRHLYGYSTVRREFGRFVILVEGPADVLKLMEVGYPAVACFGRFLSRKQAYKLAALNRFNFIAFDNDDAGWAGKAQAHRTMRSVSSSLTLPIPKGYKDFCEMPSEALSAWLRTQIPSELHPRRVQGLPNSAASPTTAMPG